MEFLFLFPFLSKTRPKLDTNEVNLFRNSGIWYCQLISLMFFSGRMNLDLISNWEISLNSCIPVHSLWAMNCLNWNIFFKLSAGPLISLFLDFWWHLLRVSKPEWAVIFMLGRGIHVTCSLRFTSGVTPANLLVACMAVELISSTYLWPGIGGGGLNGRPIAPQANALPTELCQLAVNRNL